jgi:hypothetical protein
MLALSELIKLREHEIVIFYFLLQHYSLLPKCKIPLFGVKIKLEKIHFASKVRGPRFLATKIHISLINIFPYFA